MIIYNVTVNVEDGIRDEWVLWMQKNHILDVMNTGCFEKFTFTKVLTNHGGEGTNFSIQYLCKSMKELDLYQKDYAPNLQKEHNDKFGSKTIGFRTLLEVL